ncbi:MAG: hypothetical protein AB7I25_02015 [Vicinamibacterales bacterium]
MVEDRELSSDGLQTGDIVLMLDPRSPSPVDEFGANEVGLVVRERVLVCYRRRVTELAISEAKSLAKHVMRPKSEAAVSAAQLEAFVAANRDRYRLFLTALRALRHGNGKLFERSDLMPARPGARTEDQYEKRWRELESAAQPGDLVFSRDLGSWMSSIIAWIDDGSWSHVAVVVSGGMLVEAITSGVVGRSIRSYRDPRFHVGLYRPMKSEQFNVKAAEEWASSTLGLPYSYVGAISLGLRTLLHQRTKFHTPNGMVYSGEMFLVDHL